MVSSLGIDWSRKALSLFTRAGRLQYHGVIDFWESEMHFWCGSVGTWWRLQGAWALEEALT